MENYFKDKANKKFSMLKSGLERCDPNIISLIVATNKSYEEAFAAEEISEQSLSNKIDEIELLVNKFGQNCKCIQK